MLYAFDANDVVRLRKLLIAFEQGRLLADVSPAVLPSQAGRQDTILGHLMASIPAATAGHGATGPAVLVSVDWTTSPPTLTDLTNTDKVYTVLNTQATALPAGYYLLAREPTSGYYVPAETSSTSDRWVKVTNTTTAAVNIAGGSVQQCYPALLQTVSGGGFVDSTAAWFIPTNGPLPAVNDRYYCPQIGVESLSGTPVYAVGESTLFGWSTEVGSPTGFNVTSTTPVDSGMSVTLPYVGTYLIIVRVPGQLNSNMPIPARPLGTVVHAQLYDSGAAALIGGEAAVIAFPQQLFTNSSLVSLESSCTISSVYQNTTAGNAIKVYCWVSDLQDGSAFLGGAIFDVVLLSPGAIPSATTVNGQTGGVVIASGTSGGQSPTGVGTTVSTSSGTVSVGLSPAAAASIHQSLAGANV